jgi:hypothetical protein
MNEGGNVTESALVLSGGSWGRLGALGELLRRLLFQGLRLSAESFAHCFDCLAQLALVRRETESIVTPRGHVSNEQTLLGDRKAARRVEATAGDLGVDHAPTVDSDPPVRPPTAEPGPG